MPLAAPLLFRPLEYLLIDPVENHGVLSLVESKLLA
jgi:hypothetical protein